MDWKKTSDICNGNDHGLIRIIAWIIFWVATIITPVFSDETYRFKQMFPTPIQPWYFYYPYGVATDNRGYVYVSNRNGHIVKLTADGHIVTRWGRVGKADGEFNDPAAIAVDSRRHVYVSDMKNDRIQKFTSEGEWLASWGQFNKPHGIAVDAGNRIYVADTQNNRIQILTDDGLLITTLEHGFMSPEGIAVDSDGFIYVADTGNNRILKFDTDYHRVLECSSEYPQMISASSEGFIYVTQKFTYTIRKFSGNGNPILEWGGIGRSDGKFKNPYGIAIDPKGHVYIADTENQRIQKFTSEGQFITRWGPDDSPGSFNSPKGTAATDDFIYVADTMNHRIQQFSNDGAFIRQWGKSGSADGDFSNPTGIAVDSKGFVYVVDQSNHRIQKFDSSGHFITKWGTGGSDPGQFKFPHGIAAASDDAIYVTELGNSRVQKFDPVGNLLRKWGKQGGGDGEFQSPYGIAVDSKGFVYVADAVRRCVQKFTSDGKFVFKWGSQGTDAGEFDLPYGIAVETAPGNDYVYVADSKNCRIQKFTSDGVFAAQWGAPGYLDGRMNYPSALAVRSDGSVVVADTDNHRIQIFDRQSVRSRAIIVAGGGSDPANYLWDATQKCANTAYWALMCQGFSGRDLVYLSPNAWLDLDGAAPNTAGAPSSERLRDEIIEHTEDIDHLMVYLVDHGGPSKFQLSDKDILHVSDLKNWLDTFQNRNPSVHVTVIYDACQAGSFLEPLTSESYPRTLITGASETEDAYFLSQGLISFSNLLWTGVFAGNTLNHAFDQAVVGMKAFQKPAARSSRNLEQVCVGRCTPVSGKPPVITGGKVLGSGKCYAMVEDDQTIERIWAQFRPLTTHSTGSGYPVTDLPTVDLTSAGTNVYAGVYDGFDQGEYQIIMYAKNTAGYVSVPFIRSISAETKSAAGPDLYEPDNDRIQAGIPVINGSYQKHHFHNAGDEDWMVFYARRQTEYAVQIRNEEKNSFPIIDVFESHSVNPIRVMDTSVEFTDTWEISTNQDQFVYIRIRNKHPQLYGTDTGYEFRIYTPVGTFSSYVKGYVADAVAGKPIEKAVIKTDSRSSSAISRSDGGYLMNHPPGIFTIRAESAGYLPHDAMIDIPEGSTAVQNFYLTPLFMPLETTVAMTTTSTPTTTTSSTSTSTVTSSTAASAQTTMIVSPAETVPITTTTTPIISTSTTLPASEVKQNPPETIPEIANSPSTDVGGAGCFISIIGFP